MIHFGYDGGVPLGARVKGVPMSVKPGTNPPWLKKNCPFSTPMNRRLLPRYPPIGLAEKRKVFLHRNE
ncbi:MAG: hypothetical protein NTW89_05295 [Burkholderiales bacterium]|nr:hypothetical protein [Burkholderiales bacterium]